MHYMLFIECSVTEQFRAGGRKGMGGGIADNGHNWLLCKRYIG